MKLAQCSTKNPLFDIGSDQPVALNLRERTAKYGWER
jgi:hypothetical protein